MYLCLRSVRTRADYVSMGQESNQQLSLWLYYYCPQWHGQDELGSIISKIAVGRGTRLKSRIAKKYRSLT